MTMDLRELYQEIIIDHNRNPRNQRTMPDATLYAHGLNPLCGDKLTVYLKLKEGLVTEVSFQGRGCAISQASASMMTEAVKGKTVLEAHKMFHYFHNMLTTDTELDPSSKLTALAGVRAFPARVKCATLAWHTLEAALNKEQDPVSTE